jgi:hypothetical protein
MGRTLGCSRRDCIRVPKAMISRVGDEIAWLVEQKQQHQCE